MPIKHDFTSMLQPTDHSCTQTATAMLLTHYDNTVDAIKVLKESPTQRTSEGEEAGSSMQQLASYCIDKGYAVALYSFDSIILDLTWGTLSKVELVQRLNKVKETRDVSSLGKQFTKHYVEEYIKFLEKGGSLVIRPYPTKGLLTELLRQGPLCVAVNYQTLHGTGHTRSTGLRKTTPDDTNNDITTHAILVYGQDTSDTFMVSDPWGNPQSYTVTSDQLIASIMAAQWLCDNIFFRIIKSN